jgi:ankyrin repeat protein
MSALASAAGAGNTAVVRRLLEAGADPNLPGQNDQRAIELAAFGGHLETVEALLAGGAEVRFALHAAGWSGNLELVRRLVSGGADPKALTQYGDSTIRGAASRGHLMVVEELLRRGAQPGEQALREAAQFGHVDVLRACAKAGVAFDTEPAQWDPLYTAAYHGQVESVRVLLELGASASGYSRAAATHADYPQSALEAAVAGGHGGVAALLRAAGGG